MVHRIFDKTLSLGELRSANVKRCNTVFHRRADGSMGALQDWSLTDWACAMAGEAGELCNVIKKLRRLETADRDQDTPEHRAVLMNAIAEEAADVLIYLDLLTAAAGVDLGESTRAKFNHVSEQRKTDIRL